MQVKAAALFLLLVLPAAASAGKQHSNDSTPAEQLPDAELLEFIAEFEPLEGQWIDPVQLNMIFAEKRNGKNNE